MVPVHTNLSVDVVTLPLRLMPPPHPRSMSTTAARLLSVVSDRRCLITVGTTNFDSLIRHLDQPTAARRLLTHLHTLHFTHITLQLGGTHTYDPNTLQQLASTFTPPFTVTTFTLSPSLLPTLTTSALVISHAGAGSILETMRLQLPLLVVVNEQLMNNHQREVADELASRRHVWVTTVDRVLDAIEAVTEPMLTVAEVDVEAEEEEEDEDEDGAAVVREMDTKGHCSGYVLRKYPPASAVQFLHVLEQEMDML